LAELQVEFAQFLLKAQGLSKHQPVFEEFIHLLVAHEAPELHTHELLLPLEFDAWLVFGVQLPAELLVAFAFELHVRVHEALVQIAVQHCIVVRMQEGFPRQVQNAATRQHIVHDVDVGVLGLLLGSDCRSGLKYGGLFRSDISCGLEWIVAVQTTTRIQPNLLIIIMIVRVNENCVHSLLIH